MIFHNWNIKIFLNFLDEEEMALAAQHSKIRQLQIRPLNESHPQTKLNASVDELRLAIGQIALPKSETLGNVRKA